MNIIILFLSLIILGCLLLEKWTEKTSFPPLLAFLCLGMIVGVDGIFKIDFDDFALTNNICSIALLFIMFNAGFSTNTDLAKKILIPATLMSIVGVILTSLILTALLVYIFKMPFYEAFPISAVIGSTDATTVFNILRKKKLNLKYNTAQLLEVESGSNDPAAYTMTIIAISLLSGAKQNFALLFIMQFGIGMLIGFLMTKIIIFILNHIDFSNETANIIIIFSLLLFTYAITNILNGNGYIAVYLFGILLGHKKFKDKNYILKFYDSITNISQMIIFFMLGFLVTPINFSQIYLSAILTFILLTFIARPITTFILLKPFKAPINQILYVSLAGLRGASSIVFAIFYTVQNTNLTTNKTEVYNIIFFMVLLSILFQGSLLPFAAKKLNLIDNSIDVMRTFNDYQDDSNICFMKMKVKNDNFFLNRKLSELHFTSIRIAMIIRNQTVVVPSGDTTINLNDIVVFSGAKFINDEKINFKEIFINSESNFCNKSITNIKFKKNETVIMVKRNSDALIPYGDFKFKAGDIAIISHF